MENTLKINNNNYKINFDNVKTIEDIKILLEGMDLVYRPKDEQVYHKIKHLLTPITT